MRDRRAIKLQEFAPCSYVLKQQLIDNYIDQRFGVCIRVFGMSWQEPHRMERLAKRLGTDRVWFPLAEQPYIEKDEIKSYCVDHGIEPPRLYDLGFEHNNCGGFCVRAGKAHFARLYATMPDRYLYHEQKEQEIREFLQKDVSILTETRDYVKYPLTLRAFRERLECGTAKYNPHDFGACGCFVNGDQ